METKGIALASGSARQKGEQVTAKTIFFYSCCGQH